MVKYRVLARQKEYAPASVSYGYETRAQAAAVAAGLAAAGHAAFGVSIESYYDDSDDSDDSEDSED